MFGASKNTVCHFWDCTDQVDGKPPLALVWDWSGDDPDTMIVRLHAGVQDDKLQRKATDDPDVELGVSSTGLWAALFITHATARVCFK